MARFIARVLGARGRTLSIYDTKCVINTSVTAGSILSGNATDGEKTIFYIDCVGIQYKDAGRTLGFLQMETPSMQMNNQTSNLASENTFTFEDTPGSTNAVMQLVHAAVCDLVETVKYCPPVKKEQVWDIVLKLAEADLIVDSHLLFEARDYEVEQRRKLEQETQQKRQHAQEAEQQKLEETGKQLEQIQDPALREFLTEARGCKKVMDVMALWRSRSWDHLDATQVEKIQAILDERDNLERLYGSSEKRTQEAVSNLIKLIMG